MKILVAAYYEFLKNIRDIKMIALLIIFPILTIYLLGNAIGNYLSTDTGKRITVGYVNRDTGITGKEFNKFLDIKEIKDRLDVVKYKEIDQGRKALDDGKVDTLIYLPEEMSQNMADGSKQSIKLYGNKNLAFVESLLSGFTSTYNSLNAIISTGGNPSQTSSEQAIKRIYYNKNAVLPKAIDYYSVLSLLQVLLMGAIIGVFITTRTYGTDIHVRVHSLPVGKWALLSGRILGSTMFLFLTSIITMLFSKYVFHSNWNGNPLIILGALFLFCLIAIGIGILVGLLIPSFSTALLLIFMLMLFFSVASGAITPSSTIDSLSFISPNYHAKIILFGTIYGYSKQIMIEAALWLLGFIAVIFSTVTVLLRRVGYDNI